VKTLKKNEYDKTVIEILKRYKYLKFRVSEHEQMKLNPYKDKTIKAITYSDISPMKTNKINDGVADWITYKLDTMQDIDYEIEKNRRVMTRLDKAVESLEEEYRDISLL
jgi:hypothetical protein